VTGAGEFDIVAVGSPCILPFEIGIDGSVRSRYQHPAWLLVQAGVVMTALKLSAKFSICDRAMKAPAQQKDRLRSIHETARDPGK
jgi:hypothetical protein